MLDYSSKQSLIVSAVAEENDDTTTDKSTFFEIPLDEEMMDIEVSVLKWTTPPQSSEISPSKEDIDDGIKVDATSCGDEDDHVYDDTINIIHSSGALHALAGSCSNTNGHENASGRSSPDIHMAGTPTLSERVQSVSQHNMQSDFTCNSCGRETVTAKYDNIPPSLPTTTSIQRTSRMALIPQHSVDEDPG